MRIIKITWIIKTEEGICDIKVFLLPAHVSHLDRLTIFIIPALAASANDSIWCHRAFFMRVYNAANNISETVRNYSASHPAPFSIYPRGRCTPHACRSIPRIRSINREWYFAMLQYRYIRVRERMQCSKIPATSFILMARVHSARLPISYFGKCQIKLASVIIECEYPSRIIGSRQFYKRLFAPFTPFSALYFYHLKAMLSPQRQLVARILYSSLTLRPHLYPARFIYVIRAKSADPIS